MLRIRQIPGLGALLSLKRISRPAVLAVSLMMVLAAGQYAPAAPFAAEQIRFEGQTEPAENGTLIKQRSTKLILGDDASSDYSATVPLKLAAQHGHLRVMLSPEAEKPLGVGSGMAQLIVHRDAEGWRLTTRPYVYDQQAAKWVDHPGGAMNHNYWPIDREKQPVVIEEIAGPRKYGDDWRKFEVQLGGGAFRVWLDGQIVYDIDVPKDAAGPVVFELMPGDVVGEVTSADLAGSELYLPVNLEGLDLQTRATSIGKPKIESNGVTFDLPRDGAAQIDLSQAKWRELEQDPGSYYEWYDAGPQFVGDPRQPMLRVPVADYAAAHILAYAEESDDTVPVVTFRAGRFGYAGQTFQHEFATRVPPAGEAEGATKIDAPGGALYHIRVPFDIAFAQDLTDRIDIELTKEVRLARRHPDPARFRYRPVGLPSGVKIAAVTLERSPLQMRITSTQPAHVFEQPDKPVFTVALTNITSEPQAYTLKADATHHYGDKFNVSQSGTVAPGESAEVSLEIPHKLLGHYAIDIALSGKNGKPLLTRKTSFALLPPDTREHRATSPLGTWDFFGGHFTPNDADLLGPLYRKAGLRYGMFGATPEERKKWGITQGVEPKVSGSTLEKIKEWFEKNPYADRVGLLLHEDAISGSHISRVPDLFHNRKPYKLDESEKKRLDDLMKAMIEPAKALREDGFDIHLRLGNGGLPQKEEFYRAGFPKELFDSVGNEAGVFGRPPETQPPDWVANNASLWMDRVLADHYGHTEKPVTQCYEITYPGTNPGNLSLDTQADYFVRHVMHSMAWGVPTIRIGLITDVGNSYYFSNWGAAGLLHAMPEMNPKPSYVTLATMTRVLDGAKFQRVLEMGSKSLYGVEFKRPDGKNAYVMWNLHGPRDVSLKVAGQGAWTKVDGQGNEAAQSLSSDGNLSVRLSPSPIYLVSEASIDGVTPAAPTRTGEPSGKTTLLDELASLDGWEVQQQDNPVLDYHSFMTPRRRGDFKFDPVAEFEGEKGALKVTPQPLPNDNPVLAMPMYNVLLAKKDIALPGEPTAIGLWVNGNSGQGRIIFDLVDAKGERWTSVGSPQRGEPTRWMLDWMPEEIAKQQKKVTMGDWNTDDVFGITRIDFDGWHWLEFALPGNHPGENYLWPAGSQWRYDQDGIVDYPLKVRSVIVELNEKTLHMKTYEPADRPEIYIRNLTAVEGDIASHHPRGLDGHSGAGNRR